MRRKRCVCGFMADVDEWNAKGVVMFCPECGAFDLSRDDLYEMGLQNRMMRAFLDRCRKQWKADAENPEIDDEAYRSACEMAVEMVDEMFRGLEDADREWRDERKEEVEYLWRAGIIPRNAQERPATARRFETDTRTRPRNQTRLQAVHGRKKGDDKMRGMGYETPEWAENSLARIARALERIADAEEERIRMARKAEEHLDRLDVMREDAEREGLRWGASRSSTATRRT